MGKDRLWTKDFLIVASANFFLFLSFYLLMVTISVFAVDEFGASQSTAGLASSIFIIGVLIARLYAGPSIEKIGRKKLLYIGLILSVITALLYFAVNGIVFLLINRFLHGVAFGLASTATGTIVANLIPDSRRGEGTGYYSMSVTLATAIGPFLGLFLSQHTSFSTIFITTAIFAIFSFVVSFFLKVPKSTLTKEQIQEMKGFKFSNLLEPKAVPISVISAITGFCYASVLSFLTFYAKEIHLVEAASFFFIVYAVFILASRPFTGRWFDLKGANTVMYPSLFLFGIGMLMISQAHHGTILLAAGALIGLGYGTVQSISQAISVKVSPPHRIGLATSTFFIFTDLGIGVGPFLLGFLVPITGFRSMYVMIGIVVFACLFLYYFLHGRKAASAKRMAQAS
ncbi:MFS transporter [Bacillus massiliigorillae]|uniref:MFS transporter n=1 Tax=Bacillus massiliigorillae TaxID=1243664 RepID=UPI0003A36F0B|nr:MFS transporter [Bacillus massiliigorillae]